MWRSVCKRLPAASLAAVFAVLPGIGQAATGTTIAGRVLVAQGGLPVPSATVEVFRDGTRQNPVQTDAAGVFTISGAQPGTYSFTIRAAGYQPTRAQDVLVTGQARVDFQVAVNRESAGLKQIAQTSVARNQSLQTSTTINTHVDTSALQDQNFQRLGDLLNTVPGVITSTSSSVGDDMSLSIRGFDPTETATLLDGHPIGPLGAYGGGYNYNVSPFWGLSGADVIFGSGATGIYGATTIAGAVDLQTINPTRTPELSVTQGVGSDAKLMSGFEATGMLKNFGYAFAWGVQGTNGNFQPGIFTQTALLQGSQIAAHQPINSNYAQPADMTAINARNSWNTYPVSGQYSQYNFVGKLTYDFTPRTNLLLTAYSGNDWSNSTGEGDNDYQTWPYAYYNAQQAIAALPHGVEITKLNNHKTYKCVNSLVVLDNSPRGFTCMNATQFADNLYGPFGGGPGRWRTLGNQDYHARLNQGLGAGTLSFDYFQDSYNYNEQKGPGFAGGPYYLYLYNTRGYEVSDDFALSKHDLGFGYDYLYQKNSDGSYPYVTASGQSNNYFAFAPQLNLNTSSYFVRDVWTPNLKLQAFANFWLKHSFNTQSTNLSPRITFVYRPDSSDVFRVTGGHAISEPAPALVYQSIPVYGAPSSLNPICGNDLNDVASVNDPNLKPESATDFEVAFGHRFTSQTTLQADVYQSWENMALLSGSVPIASVPQYTVPLHMIDEYLARIASVCGGHPNESVLGFSTTYNAASARYRGINLNSSVGITRNITFSASYTITSAAYLGVAQDILQANPLLIDGGQISDVPLRQATAGLAYANRTGFAARIDANYMGSYNTYHRSPFWFANGSISQTAGKVTVNLGVYNIFNSVAQQWGYIGYGVWQPENQYGTDTNAFTQAGNEQYGLPFRQVWLAAKFGI